MTSGEKLFFFILTFPFLLANTVPLEFPLVPIINCYDLNGNESSDFIAMPNSDLPRTLYHIELSSTKAEILWKYTMPEDKKGYFVDVILGDFDRDGTIELIAAASQVEKNNIFYIFSANATGFHDVPPIVTVLHNISTPINNPRKLYILEGDANQRSMFLLSQGNPNRKVIMCEFLDDKITARSLVGEKFLNNTMAPIDIALGDFNGDSEEDIFILDNGFNPTGYFVYSDGNEEESDLSNYPRLKFLNEKGVDINFDGSDDLVIINRNGELMSNIWGTESISLSEKKIQNINTNLDNGFIYLTSISQTGKIGNFIIDPLTRSILSTNFELPEFKETDYSHVFSLVTSTEIFISHDGNHPEIYSLPQTMKLIIDTPTPKHLQRIYYREPDYVINVGKDFFHHIEEDSSASFRNFTEENIPTGMGFDLEEIKLVWAPTQNQLGYHKLSYTLELMKKGNLEIVTDEGKKIVNQNEHIIEKNYSYLIYVNDLVAFNKVNDHITIVNGELFKQIIPIMDKNGDAQLSVEIISSKKEAKFQMYPIEVFLDSLESMSGPSDIVPVDIDTIQIEVKKIIVNDSLYIQLPDSFQTAEKIADTLIKLEELEEVLMDSNYLEISYAELITHQAQFSWKPQTKPNDYNFTLEVNDGFTSDTMVLTLTVHPQIDLSMNTTQLTATVGVFFNVDLIHKQIPPSENYEYILNNAPENMRINTTGSINWVPLSTQVDNYNFDIEVTDGIASTRLQYDIYINAPPVISLRPPKIFILPKGEKLNFALKSFDLNSNTKLEWKLLSGPTEMILSQQGDLLWNGNELGHHAYEIQLTDGIDSVQWKASIYVNTPPVIITTPIKTISKGEKYFYPLFAHDENVISPHDSLVANEIIFSLIQGPEGMNIDENNTLVWETGDNPPGENMVAIIASDGANDAIQVFSVFINSFPVITSPDSVTVSVEDTLKFQIKAHDPNPMDTLTFHLDTLYKNLVIELHSGLLTWIPKKSDIGLHTFNLQVKDGHGDIGTKMKLHIYVFSQPQLTSELSSEAFSDIEFSAFLTAEDMYGNKLSGPESIIIDTATFNYYNFSKYTHLFKWTPGEADKGDHEIVIKLMDDSGFTTYHAHKLSVFANPCVHCDNEDKSIPADTTGN